MSTLNLENIKHPDSASNNISVDSSGNVGIGTGSPSGRLHVAGSGSDLFPKLEATTAGYAVNLQLIGNNASGSRYNNISSRYGSTEQWYIGGGGSDSTIAFRTGSASTERMRIDSAGRVTMPYQPAVHLVNTSNISGTGLYSGWTARVNVGNHYNTGTGVFTCPVAGVYMVHAMIWRNTALVDYAVRLNASDKGRVRNSTTNDAGYSMSILFNCAVNDTIDFVIKQNPSNDLYGATGYSETLTSAVIKFLG